MDIRAYFQKVRETERNLSDAHVVIASLETPEGGKAGRFTEVSRASAAQLIVEIILKPQPRDGEEAILQAQVEVRRDRLANAGNRLPREVAVAVREVRIVIVDAALRHDELIGEAMPHQEFAAFVAEGREVRIVGRHDRSHLRHRVSPELQNVSVVQRVKVPGGIEVDPVARLRDSDREGCRAAKSVQSRAPHLAIPQPLVAVVA